MWNRLITLSFLLSIPALAQDVGWGGFAGASYPVGEFRFLHDSNPAVPITGWHGGLFLEKRMDDLGYARISVSYHSFVTNGVSSSNNVNGDLILVPDGDRYGPYALAGLSFTSFEFVADTRGTPTSPPRGGTTTQGARPGLRAGFGYRGPKGLFAEAHYNWTKTSLNGPDALPIAHAAWIQVSLGWRFGSF